MPFLQDIKQFIWPSAVTLNDDQRKHVSHTEWSLSQEREFMEGLVYKRLTLFLTVAGALITGAISLRDSPGIATALLLVGTILCWVLQQTVHRAQLKLDIILQILFADDTHPTGRVNTIYTDKNRVRLIGVAVPSAICLLLTVLTTAGAAVTADWIDLPSAEEPRPGCRSGKT
ncbi:hypothetical protein [Sphingomonas psychrotolerans]|uniref:Uncharacterized protein n=1 Tax=Sphingomonas psychrotolerans TaxID=1327635 RepID=A0A2K8MCR5_9SPHN|nr:hypothetical protein [Sphingomonas psychrotolerans]ATY31690.1 hypothetical protein CVN68_06670 [Sphingomonas psychrotolerans]